MTPLAATKHPAAPQTPPLPQGKPEALGLSPVRLQRLSDAFKREIDKGTLPGATVMVARRGQIGWFEALGRQSPAASAPMAHNSIFRIFSMTNVTCVDLLPFAFSGSASASAVTFVPAPPS